MVVVACSDTESTIVSVAINKGFAALRYLDDPKLSTPEETIAIPAIIAPPKSTRPLRNWALLITFLIIVNTTRNTVHPIRKNSEIPITVMPLVRKLEEKSVFSYSLVTKKNTDVKITEVHMMNLLSFLRNGNARKKSPMGKIKNCMPPHEARPKASKIPAPTIFATETFPLSDFIPLISR